MQPNPLDVRLARLLVARGVLTQERAREALGAAARHPQDRGGSKLAHLLAVHRVLTPADCDRWLQVAQGTGASGEWAWDPRSSGEAPLPGASATFAPGVPAPGPGDTTFAPGVPRAAPDPGATFAPGLHRPPPPASGAPSLPSPAPAPAVPDADLTFVPGGVPAEGPAGGDMTLPPDEAATLADLGAGRGTFDGEAETLAGNAEGFPSSSPRGTGRVHAPDPGDATFAADLAPAPRGTGPLPHDVDATLLYPADYVGGGGAPGAVGDDATLMAVPSDAMSSGFGRSPIGGVGPHDTVLEQTRAQGGESRRPTTPLAGVLVDLFRQERYRLTSVVDPTRVEATDLRLRAPVVVRKPGEALPPDAAEQFLREAYVLAQLDHPAIPRVHDAGVENGEPYFTLEPLEGKPLGRGERSTQELLRAFCAVAGAVEHAHSRGLVHGALNPKAVRLGTFGRVWVTDWGAALALPESPPAVQQALRVRAPTTRVQRAPELGRSRAPSERVDVWGLGKVLEGVLAACEHDPALRPLRAVAARALEAVPAKRYRSAQAVRREVERFLDGERVLADDESLLAGARRLARKHPIQAAALGLVALVALGFALYTSRSVHRSWTLAVAAQEQTEAQREASKARLAEAREAEALAQAEQARAARHLEFARALDEALRAASAAVAEAQEPTSEDARAHNAAQNERVLAAFARAERLARGLQREAPEALRALLATRGEWALRRSLAPPALRQALEDFRAWGELEPSSAQAQLGRYVAANRLPTAADAEEEQAALEALSELDGPWGRLGRIALWVREAEAARDRGDQPAAERPGHEALDALESLLTDAPELRTQSWVYELEGRAHQALAGLQLRGSAKGLFAFDLAAHLDPRSPAPPRLLLRFWNLRWGFHLSWTLASRAWCGKLLAVSEYTERPEPLVELAAYLQQVNRCAASLSLLERAFARRRGNGRQDAEFWLRAELLRLRAQLAAGGETERTLPDYAALPEELHAQAAFLHAHEVLLRGDGDVFQRELDRGMQSLERSGPLEVGLALGDLFNLLSDPRTPNLLPFLEQAFPPIGQLQDAPPYPPLVAGIAARLRWLTLTQGSRPQRVGRHLEWLAQRMQAFQGQARLQGIFLCCQARWLLSQGRADPGPTHVALLDAWAHVNVGNAFRGAPPEVRALLEGRLRALGKPRLADGLQGVDPEREVWVRRWWVPPELYAEDTWGGR
ncbi:MAG: protein kinase [Planctomycetota bacterium]